MGARARHPETPCPHPYDVGALRSPPYRAQLESMGNLTASAGTGRNRKRWQRGCAVPAFLYAGTAQSAASAHLRSSRAARPAARMGSKGAADLVISSTWRAAWWRRRSKPGTTVAPAWRAAVARGVGQGW